MGITTLNGDSNGNGKAKKMTIMALGSAAFLAASAKAGSWAWDKGVQAVSAEVALHATVAAHSTELAVHDKRLETLEGRQPISEGDAQALIRELKALRKKLEGR